MADTLDLFLLGKHWTVASIAPITFNATTGAATVGSAVDLISWVFEHEENQEVEAEDIRPINKTLPNMVPISEGESLRLVVLAQSADENSLTEALRPPTINKRFRISWTVGAEAKVGDFTFLGRTAGIRGRGQQTIEARFGPADLNNTSQVTFS